MLYFCFNALNSSRSESVAVLFFAFSAKVSNFAKSAISVGETRLFAGSLSDFLGEADSVGDDDGDEILLVMFGCSCISAKSVRIGS